MEIAVVGDIHGKIDMMLEKVNAVSKDIEVIFQLGDFGAFLSEDKLDKATIKHDGFLTEFKDYYEGKKKLHVPVYFIKGNHEDFDLLEQFENRWKNEVVKNLFYIPNKTVFELSGLKIAALGGNFSYNRYKFDKGHNRLSGWRRRHFNYQDIEALLNEDIDIILAHNPHYEVIDRKGEPLSTPIEPIHNLIKKTNPKYYFSGHLHKYYEQTLDKTKIISLDQIDGKEKSIYVLDV